MQLLNENIISARKCLIAFLCLFFNLQVCSQEADKVGVEPDIAKSNEIVLDSISKSKKNIFQKVLSYFDDSNKLEKSE